MIGIRLSRLISLNVLTTILVCSSQLAISQRKIRLLYIVDAKTPYLIPYIDNKLSKLSAPGSNDKTYQVTGLDVLADGARFQSDILDQVARLNHSENVGNLLQQKSGADDQKVARLIKNSNLILKIKIYPFNNLLEYQFMLYRVVAVGSVRYSRNILNRRKKVTDSTFTVEYLRNSTVVIDPSKQNFDEDLTLALKHILIEVHGPVKFKIKANRRISDSIYYYSNLDTIELQPLILRKDAREDEFKYTWQQLPPSTLGVRYDSTERTPEIIKPATGSYLVGLSIDDGVITPNAPECISIKVINQPKLQFLTNPRGFNGNTLIIQNYIWSGHQSVYVPSIALRPRLIDAQSDSVKLIISLNDSAGKPVFDIPQIIKNKPVLINLIAASQFKRKYTLYDLNRLPDTNRYDTVKLNQNIDMLNTGDYDLQIRALYKNIPVDPIRQQLNVRELRGTGLYFSYLVFPISKFSLMNSWMNLEIGPCFYLDPLTTVTFAPGVNVFGTTHRKFFGDIKIDIKPDEAPINIGASVLVYNNLYTFRTESALGYNVCYVFRPNIVNLFVGPTGYYSFNAFNQRGTHFAMAINFGTQIFIDKKRK